MLKGSIVALITPFLNNRVNYDKLEELLDFHLENDTDGLLLLGTTAETSTLTTNECRNIVKFCVEYLNNSIDILVGVCSNNTQKVIDDCKFYESLGVNQFLVISPYYNKTNTEGLYKHFSYIAQNINSNIIIYNIPGRTNISIPFDTIKKLSLIKNIIGIKDANENLKETIKLFSLQSEKFYIYGGNDEYIIPFLSLGAKGIMNVSGNIIPKEIHNIYQHFQDNKPNEGLKIFNLYRELIYSIFTETNPIGIKEAMFILNLNNKEMRLPLTSMEYNNSKLVKKEILKLGKYFTN